MKCAACVATFAVFIKEFGVRDTLRASGIMVLTATLAGALVNWIF